MHINIKRTVVIGLLAIALQPYDAVAQTDAVEKAIAELFTTASLHNASLKSCRAAIVEAEVATQSAQMLKLPDITFEASASYIGNGHIWNRNFSESHSVKMPHFGNNFALRAMQSIYTGGRITAQLKLSRQAAEKALLNAEAEEQRMRFLLVGLYLQLHSLKNSEEIYAANAELSGKLIEKMKRRREQGVVLRNDVTRYELLHEQHLLGHTKVHNRRLIAAHQLQTALGTEKPVRLLSATDFKTENHSHKDESLWQQTAKSAHTALRNKQMDVEMKRTQEKLERAAMRPDISIVAEDQLNGPITFEIPTLNKNFNHWFVGVGIRYDISSLYKGKRRIQQAQRAIETAAAQLETERKRIADEVQQAYINQLTAQTELLSQEKNVQLAAENYDVVIRRYEQGLCLVTDLTDAANVKLNAELALADARIELIYSIYALRFATGIL